VEGVSGSLCSASMTACLSVMREGYCAAVRWARMCLQLDLLFARQSVGVRIFILAGTGTTPEVSSKTLNVTSMLSAAFLKAELEFLYEEPRFQKALKTVTTTADFARLCELSEDLIGEYGRANKSAQQFRVNFRGGPGSK
jgi:hypothetical protein